MSHRLDLASIARAMEVIDPVFLHSPQFLVESLRPVLMLDLVVKVETLNPIRSFKGRGASYFVAGLPNDASLVCASAGNFGQAMAYCCRARGLELVVYASVNANALKVERMRALGAEVRLEGEDFDAAKAAARRFAEASGREMVEDGRQVAISEGAGTLGLELLRDAAPFDTVVVPLGNGAMLAGIARWVKAHAPQTRVIGVGAAGAPAMVESWRTGRIVEHESINTIADGIGVRVPIPEAVDDLRDLVDDMLLVSDDAIVEAMRLLHRHVGVVVEPAGAAGVAALLTHGEQLAGQRVATILCGGNMTEEQIARWLR